MSIIQNIELKSKDYREFFEENNYFKTLQVQLDSGLWAKRKKETILNKPNRYKRIQINSTGYTNVLAFDCDHEDPLLYQDYDLPQPTMTIINKENSKHHHLYYLSNPIPVELNNTKTNKLYADIYDSMTNLLEADTNYTNFITKNYMSSDYRVIGSLEKYKLNDFTEFIKVQNLNKIEKKETVHSRHIRLFDEIRLYGYSIAPNFNDIEQLHSEIQKYADRLNMSFIEPINTKYIVKSVSEFCFENRDNFRQKYIKKSKEEVSKTRSEVAKNNEKQKRKNRILTHFQNLINS